MIKLTKQTMSDKKQKILIIDTDLFIRHTLSSKIQDTNIEVETADQYGKAITLIEKEKFDVIVMDMIMPLFSGFPILDTIQKSAKNKNATIFVLTNLQQENDVKKVANYPIYDYIIKHNTDLDIVSDKIKNSLKDKPKPLSSREKESLIIQIETLNKQNKQEGQPKTSILKCSKCEAVLPPLTEFCPYCGTKVESNKILQQNY